MTAWRFVMRRLLAMVLQLMTITLLAWGLFFVIADLTGSSPADRVAGKTATPERIAQVEHILGTDRPYYEQYLRFAWHALHLDFGYSFVERRPVSDIVLPAAGTTASLVVGAAVLWMAIAIPVGLVGATRPGGLADRALMVAVLIGISMPVFWLSPMLSYYLAYEPTQGRLFGLGILPIGTRIFPIDGYVPISQGIWQWFHHLMLPWIALAIGFAAIYARFVRALMLEQLSQDYVRTAQAKGAGRRRILYRHAGRNVAPVVITLLGLDVGVALGGSLFVETIFGLPGLGYVGLSSIENLDYPLTVGIITFAAICAVVANTIVDLVNLALDPRARADVAVGG